MDALPNYSRIIHNLVRQTANDEVKFTDRMQYHRPAMYQAAFDVSVVCTRLNIVIFVGLICIKDRLFTPIVEKCIETKLDDPYQ